MSNVATDNIQNNLHVCTLVTNVDCARVAKRANIDTSEFSLIIPALNYKRGTGSMAGVATQQSQATYPKQAAIMFPTISHDCIGESLENKKDFDIESVVSSTKKVFADSVAAVEFAQEHEMRFDVGPHVPVVNGATAKYFASLGAECIWLSPELSIKQIRDITTNCKDVHFGLTVIGTQELMITEHCELMSLDWKPGGKNSPDKHCACSQECMTCNRRSRPHYLVDRKGYEFPVVTDILGRSHIYNSVQQDVCHAIAELIDAGVTHFMVDSSLLNVEQTAQAVGRVSSAVKMYLENPKNPKCIDKPKNTTTGHLFREVL